MEYTLHSVVSCFLHGLRIELRTGGDKFLILFRKRRFRDGRKYKNSTKQYWLSFHLLNQIEK